MNNNSNTEQKSSYMISVPSQLLEDQTLKGTDIGSYVAARSFSQNGKGECWASLREIAKRMHCDKNTIGRSLIRLEKSGHIQIVGTKTNWRGGKGSVIIKFPYDYELRNSSTTPGTNELVRTAPTHNELVQNAPELVRIPYKVVKVKVKQEELNNVQVSNSQANSSTLPSISNNKIDSKEQTPTATAPPQTKLANTDPQPVKLDFDSLSNLSDFMAKEVVKRLKYVSVSEVKDMARQIFEEKTGPLARSAVRDPFGLLMFRLQFNHGFRETMDENGNYIGYHD